jgi:hypothetical protein
MWNAIARRFRRYPRFASPGDLDQFVTQMRADLDAAGLHGAAQGFARIQRTAFTTGSEWLGELGIAVKEIRKAYAVPAELDVKLERIMAEVRRVWPSL